MRHDKTQRLTIAEIRQFTPRIPIALMVQVRKRVQAEGHWQECKRLARALAKFLGSKAARPMALYCMPRDDGHPHEFTGLMPKYLRVRGEPVKRTPRDPSLPKRGRGRPRKQVYSVVNP